MNKEHRLTICEVTENLKSEISVHRHFVFGAGIVRYFKK